MNTAEWIAAALAGWTAVGLLGLAVSLMRRERRQLGQGVGSLLGVWIVYLAVLGWFSYRQPEQRLTIGQSRCFHALCLKVERTDEVVSFPARAQGRLVRVTIRVANRAGGERQEELRATIEDRLGRRWEDSGGVSGNPLNGRLVAKSERVSEPVFRIAADAAGLNLRLEHARWSVGWIWHRMVIGDAESLWHRPAVFVLDR